MRVKNDEMVGCAAAPCPRFIARCFFAPLLSPNESDWSSKSRARHSNKPVTPLLTPLIQGCDRPVGIWFDIAAGDPWSSGARSPVQFRDLDLACSSAAAFGPSDTLDDGN